MAHAYTPGDSRIHLQVLPGFSGRLHHLFDGFAEGQARPFKGLLRAHAPAYKAEEVHLALFIT